MDWLAVLEPRLAVQQAEIEIYERYDAGRHRLSFVTDQFREAFARHFGPMADNWCPLIVQASVERLQVTGFRFGEDTASDSAAWDIWQRNNLDAEQGRLHYEAIKDGVAYTLVDPNEGAPRITVEHASQVYVMHAAGDRTQRIAALKKWQGEDGYAYANVYLPDEVQKFRTNKPLTALTRQAFAPATPGSIPLIFSSGASQDISERWIQIDSIPNPLGVVPVVPFYNNATMLAGGISDLRVAIPLQDAINKTLLDMLVASEFAAYPQRYVIGWEPPRDPETGEILADIARKSAVSRLLSFGEAGVQVGQFSAADLSNYTKEIEALVQHLAAQTRTPPHYLLGSIVNASGDALAAAETGLVSKVRKKIQDFSDPWEETTRLAFIAKDDPVRSEAYAAHSLWSDPEQKTDAQKADAATKYRSIGVPLESCLQIAGFSQQEIDRMKQQPDWGMPAPAIRDTASFRETRPGLTPPPIVP